MICHSTVVYPTVYLMVLLWDEAISGRIFAIVCDSGGIFTVECYNLAVNR